MHFGIKNADTTAFMMTTITTATTTNHILIPPPLKHVILAISSPEGGGGGRPHQHHHHCAVGVDEQLGGVCRPVWHDSSTLKCEPHVAKCQHYSACDMSVTAVAQV